MDGPSETLWTLSVDSGTGDAEKDDHAAADLRKELEEIGFATTSVPTPLPPGAKSSSEAVAIATVAINILPTLLPPLISAIRQWMDRSEGRAVRFKFKGTVAGAPCEISDLTVDELVRVIGAMNNTARR